ncbi:uncharacterized protein LOC9648072 isoform X2 [Selaginella moellendorffii]|uniref:uncharacterized protein LOC9648072 isoform X2 n=1 Tax=Selaginella moellendorffii TaxID=88036 RepID=UPI000D1CE289|nr:uncharacterized protein LOC9648072 isoform X2 [Selaginella moellendorffii]|eukprot:XP_024540941.1 uncharacterized protein LOC9648072 isoform X2 [Selaginella moellendorffii]
MARLSTGVTTRQYAELPPLQHRRFPSRARRLLDCRNAAACAAQEQRFPLEFSQGNRCGVSNSSLATSSRRTKFLRSLEYCGLRSSEYAAGAIRNVKKMVKSARKKSYTLAVGKPNPAKLANIPEYWRKKTHNVTRSTLRRETRLSYGCNL